jgi:CHAT domain-containing protein
LAADGREISGIAQSFIEAGADTVVASLWLVNAPTTSELMQSFYRHLASGTTQHPITIAQALQKAQLDLLRNSRNPAPTTVSNSANPTAPNKPATITAQPQPRTRSAARYAHPYFWSAFIMIGNGL